MNFVFNTVYDMDALTVMARAVRKTTHKKKSKRSHIFGVIVIALAILLVVVAVLADDFNFNTFITSIAGIAILAALIFEDRLNAFIALKRMIKGSEKGVVTFGEDNFVSSTEVGTTEFKYNIIEAIARRGDYIVFVLSRRHAQVYDLTAMSNGTPKEFCRFIEEKTGLKIQKI
ncbi:MAG: YcxB family protein [Oscillospiraceae bacterium]|nr:YcxB family protein [Oscillospiraceae bacterium]